MDPYTFAMDMELDGIDYYKKLEKASNNKNVKSIFNILADEELKHYFAIKEYREHKTFTPQTDLSNIDNIFEKLMDNKDEYESHNDQKDVYAHALDLEEESIKFYVEQRDKSTDNNEKLLFQQLINEEKKHKLLIKNIIDFVSKPEDLRGVKTVNSDPEFARWKDKDDN